MFAADQQRGWFLLPIAWLSFFIYSPEQNLRRPRPRWIPYVLPNALVVLSLALGIWASEFPAHWYLVPVALLLFFQDNTTEETLQQERKLYDQPTVTLVQDAERAPHSIWQHELAQGSIWVVVGVFMLLIAFSDFSFDGSADQAKQFSTGRVVVFFLIGLFPLIGGLNTIIRYFVDRRIDGVMHEPIEDHPEPSMQDESEVASKPAAMQLHVAQASNFEFEVISSLPASSQYGGRLTASRNWLGGKPPKILMLWNFARTSFQQYRTMLGIEHWLHTGPVYMLASRNGLPLSRFFYFRQSGSLRQAFIQSKSQFDKLLQGVKDKPIIYGLFSWPDGKPRGYPLHNWLCTANTWQSSVYALCDHVDAVVLDARGFNAERIGLAWEVGCLVDRVSTDKFVVLTDPTTVMDELRKTFENAWQNMAADSPNRTATVAIRVLHGVDAMHFETRKRFPEKFYRFEATQVAQFFPETK